MNNTNTDICFAHINWQDKQPFSSQFNDVYFSTDDGEAETNYVFIAQNRLITRFKNLKNQQFTIAETGFGTGLNFLCAWQTWLTYAPAQASLHFISCEKYPITMHDLTISHQQWPEFAAMSCELIKQYHLTNSSNNSITCEFGRVKLSLLLQDASSALSQLSTEKIQVDAWFLDGFTPSKNPDMWTEELFAQMARLSHLNTTFATFTSASAVRRGLQNVGFIVNKLAGFGKKREMLAGDFNQKHNEVLRSKNQNNE